KSQYIEVLQTYSFPVVTLPASTSLAAICTVFETLNRSGKPLGAFELLTARYYPDGVNLRDLWSDSLAKYPLLDDQNFGVDPYSVLQAIALLKRDSAQRNDVLNQLTAIDVKDHWDSVVAGFDGVLRM